MISQAISSIRVLLFALAAFLALPAFAQFDIAAPKCTIAAGASQVHSEGGTCGGAAHGDQVTLTDASSTSDCGTAAGGSAGGGAAASLCIWDANGGVYSATGGGGSVGNVETLSTAGADGTAPVAGSGSLSMIDVATQAELDAEIALAWRPNTLFDRNGDGTVDSIICADYDGNGMLDTALDIGLCVDALNAAAGTATHKHITIPAGTWTASWAACDAADDADCKARMGIGGGLGLGGPRGMIQLDSNTILEGAGRTATSLLGFQMDCTDPGNVTGIPLTEGSYAVLSNLNHEPGSSNENIEVRNIHLDGGACSLYERFQGGTGPSGDIPLVRIMDWWNVDELRVDNVHTSDSTHAGIFIEDSSNVVVSNSLFERDGGYGSLLSGEVLRQASIYLHVTDRDLWGEDPSGWHWGQENRSITLVGNRSRYSGGPSINLRNDHLDPNGGRIFDTFIYNHVAEDVDECVVFRGMSDVTVDGLTCNLTKGISALDITSWYDTGRNRDITLRNITLLNGNGDSQQFIVPRHSDGWWVENILVKGSDSDEYCFTIDAPVRNLSVKNITLSQCGQGGLKIAHDSGAVPNERIEVDGLTINGVGYSSAGLDARNCIDFTDSHIGFSLKNVVARGCVARGIDFNATGDYSGGVFENVSLDGTPPEFLGTGTEAVGDAYVCDAEHVLENFGVTDASGTTDCNTSGGTGSTDNSCMCVLSDSGAATSGGTNSITDSGGGWTTSEWVVDSARLVIREGEEDEEWCRPSANTGTTITCSSTNSNDNDGSGNWNAQPVATDTYNLYRFDDWNPPTESGIQMKPGSGSDISDVEFRNLTVRNFRDNSAVGIKLQANGGTVDDIRFTGSLYIANDTEWAPEEPDTAYGLWCASVTNATFENLTCGAGITTCEQDTGGDCTDVGTNAMKECTGTQVLLADGSCAAN